MTQEYVDACKEMHEHTRGECAKCRIPYSCCSEEQCSIARLMMQDMGVVPPPAVNPKVSYLGKDGCVLAPHLRPLCTLHTCEINSLGFKRNDPAWTERYFELRAKIDEAYPI